MSVARHQRHFVTRDACPEHIHHTNSAVELGRRDRWRTTFFGSIGNTSSDQEFLGDGASRLASFRRNDRDVAKASWARAVVSSSCRCALPRRRSLAAYASERGQSRTGGSLDQQEQGFGTLRPRQDKCEVSNGLPSLASKGRREGWFDCSQSRPPKATGIDMGQYASTQVCLPSVAAQRALSRPACVGCCIRYCGTHRGTHRRPASDGVHQGERRPWVVHCALRGRLATLARLHGGLGRGRQVLGGRATPGGMIVPLRHNARVRCVTRS